MSSGYLWTIDSNGIPNRLKATVSPNIDDYLQWISEHVNINDVMVSIVKLAATPQCVYAIDHHGGVYLFVTHSDIDIRIVEEKYENQVDSSCIYP
jgi:hypothetical protein